MQSLFLVGLALLCQADADTRYRAQLEAAVPIEIAQAESQIKYLKSIKGGRREVIKAMLDGHQKRLVGLKNGEVIPVLRLNLSKPKIGDFGTVPADSIFVTQVIDGKNLLARVLWINDDRDRIERVHWVELDTTGIADKMSLDTSKIIFEVMGTKHYETVIGGSSTVWHLRKFVPKP